MPELMTQIQRVRTLVETYESHHLQYQRSTYNETEVRVDFVNPFFQSLGWDVLNKKGLPQHLREVKHEANVVVSEDGINRKKRPDYSFRAGTEPCFFLETKKPSVDIMVASEPAFQLRRYGWSGNLTVSILTNFTDLVIYDCSVRPLENDMANTAVVAHYHYTEYADKFEEIYDLISKDSVVSGTFTKTFSRISSALTKEPFDDYFLSQIKHWRNIVSQDIVDNNGHLSAETLNIFVQKLLNRIVFLRICEDRNFEKYESLKKVENYSQLKGLFISADRKYDSGLFDLIDDQTLIVSDEVILAIFKDLYYPNSSYEFSVVDPYIIGQIYETFLVETVNITSTGIIECVGKPEAVDSQGAVNTPKNIADFIINETLSPLFEGKSLDEVADHRIADICCGSGNFLLSTFEYMINHFVEYYRNTSIDDALRQGKILATADGQILNLSYKIKRRILSNNIFGVDIDALAVEVTKLSLMLKLLESVSPDELDEYMISCHEKVLPNLDGNIKCGNSLVDSKYVDYNSDVLNDMELLTKLKIFDWEREFRGVKFDAIVGNPPYIRVQKMVHYSPEEYQYYKTDSSGFTTSKAALLDKYYLFMERGLSLLSEKGILGYIIPHRFMNITSGKELRKWLSEHKSVRRITHFGTYQVFPGRDTYTCVIVLAAKEQDSFELGFVKDWNKFLFEHTSVYDTYDADLLSDAPWTFLSSSIQESLYAVESHCVRLDALTEIFVGLQTSADPIYIIKPEREDNLYVYFIDKDGQPRKIEKNILKKSIYDYPLKKYERIEYNTYIIFPYKVVAGKPVLYSVEEMMNLFPLTYQYMTIYKDELARRNMLNRKEENWFAYGRSQSIKRFVHGRRLIWSVLSIDANYVFDDEAIMFTGGGNGPYYGLQLKADTQESIFYIQAVLNYWLMERLVKAKASTFRGDYYSHGKQFIASLPIFKINFNEPLEVKAHDDVVQGIQAIMNLTQQKNVAQTQQKKQTIERVIASATNRIETILDSLYRISRDGSVSR